MAGGGGVGGRDDGNVVVMIRDLLMAMTLLKRFAKREREREGRKKRNGKRKMKKGKTKILKLLYYLIKYI